MPLEFQVHKPRVRALFNIGAHGFRVAISKNKDVEGGAQIVVSFHRHKVEIIVRKKTESERS